MKRTAIAAAILIVCAVVVALLLCRQEPPATRLRGADLLRLAPADTTLALVVNYRKLRESGITERGGRLAQLSEAGQAAVGTGQMQTIAMFIGGDSLAAPVLSAVATHKPEDAPQVLARIEEKSLGSTEIGGLKAYRMPDNVVAVPAGEGTVLFANSGEGLDAVMRSCHAGKGAPPAHLLSSARPFVVRQICFVFLPTDRIRKQLQDEVPELPSWCSTITRIAGGMDFTETDFTLHATAVFADSDAARRALEVLGPELSEATDARRQQLERMKEAGMEGAQVEIAQQMLAVLDAVELSGDGDELQLRASMDLDTLEKAGSIVMTMLLTHQMRGSLP